jgi:hypothetical protein
MHIEWVVEYVLNAYLTRSKECMPVIESLASTVDPNHSVLANMVKPTTLHSTLLTLLSAVSCLLSTLLVTHNTGAQPNPTLTMRVYVYVYVYVCWL